MGMENPIYIEAEGDYDYSVSCDKTGRPDAPWMVTVKITQGPDHDTTHGQWKSPAGYVSYEDGKAAGIEKAVSLIRGL